MDRSNQGLRTEPFKKTVRIPWTVLSRHSLPKLHTIVRNIIPSGGEGLPEYGTTMNDQRVWDTDIDRLLNLAGAPTDFAVVGQPDVIVPPAQSPAMTRPGWRVRQSF